MLFLNKIILKKKEYANVISVIDKIFINRLNYNMDISIIKAYEQVYNMEINENSVTQKLIYIKTNINNVYFNIFMNACLKSNNYNILKRMKIQIEIFFKGKNLEEKHDILNDLKWYYSLTLFMFLFVLLFINEVDNMQSIFLLFFIIATVIYYSTVVLTYYFNYESKYNLLFQYYYLTALFEKPLNAYDLSCERFKKEKNRFIEHKIKILNNKPLCLKKNKYSKINEILYNTLIENKVLKSTINNNECNDSFRYLKKVLMLSFFLLPIILYILIGYYL